MFKKPLLLCSILVIVSMILPACMPAAGPASGVPAGGQAADQTPEVAINASPEFKNPDTLTIITGAGEQETLDPAYMYDTASTTLALNLYEGLLFFDRERTDKYIPALATDWTQNTDGTEWVFNIRKGVKFHKGGTLEPHDVAYTAARTMLQGRLDGYSQINYEAYFGADLAMASIKDFAAVFSGKETYEELTPEELTKVCEAIKSKVVADDAAGTVTYYLNQPVPWFFSLLSQQFMGATLDQEWMTEIGDWNGECDTWTQFADPAVNDTKLFNQANGTGPYMLDHWTPGEETILTAFPEYWRTEPMWEGGPSGVASIKRVVIKNIDEWGTRLSMFQAGDADYIYTPPVYRPQLNPQLRFDCGNDEASCKEVNPNGYIRGYRLRPQPAETPLQLNWNINVEGGNPYLGSGQLDGSGAPPDIFSDIHVRRAFNYCFDYSAMVKDALSGEGIQAQGPVIQGMIGYIEGMEPPFKFDLEKCAEEFKLADLDKDGIPAGEDTDDIWNLGFYMQMTYNSGNDTRRMSLEIMKSGIEQVNPKFTVQVVALPFAVQLESRRQGRLPIVAQGWVEDFHDPHNWVRPFLHSQGAFGRVIRLPEDLASQIDGLIAEGTSYTDPEKRRVVYEKLQKLTTDQAINVWMYQQLDANYFQTWVHGFYYNPAYGNPEYGWIYSLSKVAP